MFKKSLLVAVGAFVAVAIKNIISGDKLYLEEYFMFFVITFFGYLLKEWTDIPYDWNKNKRKEKQDLFKEKSIPISRDE